MSTALTRGRDDCATATLLAALTRGLSVVREPRLVRARFEEELRALLKATSITLRDDRDGVPLRPEVVVLDVPGPPFEPRQRLEAVFEPGRQIDQRTRQMLSAAASIAGLLMEIERANGRWPLACARSRTDGAAPLIGSTPAIRLVRERIEKVAVTDFTILIEGAIGPEPHPSFIEVFGEAAAYDRDREMAGAGKKANVMPGEQLSLRGRILPTRPLCDACDRSASRPL